MLRFPDWVLRSRIRGRMDAMGVTSAEAYSDLLGSQRGEIDVLVEALRVGETRFFRHRSAMDALAEEVVPALRRSGRTTVRAWSAGCASGEEAYSLAILLRQGLAPQTTVDVLATDISEQALDVARDARYPDDALAHVPTGFRTAFVPTSGGWRVADEFAKLVRFERRNITDGGFPQQNDLILCRNVLIYFDPSARTRAIERMISSLDTGGYLFLGYSETLRDFPALEPVRTARAVLYRKTDTPAGRARAASLATAPTAPAAVEPAPAAAAVPASGRVVLSGRYEGKVRITRELGEVMKNSHGKVVVEADGAELLDDEAAAVLRRARAAAKAAGLPFRILASRPGTRRWLRRMGLSDD